MRGSLEHGTWKSTFVVNPLNRIKYFSGAKLVTSGEHFKGKKNIIFVE